jgi:aspartyl protease family protein
MGIQDRDWSREAQRERELGHQRTNHSTPHRSTNDSLKWGPLGIVLFWLLIMGFVYLGMNHFMKTKAAVVSASGDLRIKRGLDGHFHVPGTINGQPIVFLVDTGATHVSVNEAFAQSANLQGGEKGQAHTANGVITVRNVRDATVAISNASVSGLTVSVGLMGDKSDQGLLGQNFLSKFDVSMTNQEMILKPRSR